MKQSNEATWIQVRVGGLLLTETTTYHLLRLLTNVGYETDEAVVAIYNGKIKSGYKEEVYWFPSEEPVTSIDHKVIIINDQPYNLVPDENGIIGTYNNVIC